MTRKNGFFYILSMAALLLTACNPLKSRQGRLPVDEEQSHPRRKIQSQGRDRRLHPHQTEQKTVGGLAAPVADTQPGERRQDACPPRLPGQCTRSKKRPPRGRGQNPEPGNAPPWPSGFTNSANRPRCTKRMKPNSGGQPQTVPVQQRVFQRRSARLGRIEGKRRRAKVYYIVDRQQPFMLKDININVDNYNLKALTKNYTKYTLLKTGERFDMDKLEEERTRLTRYFRRKVVLLLQQGIHRICGRYGRRRPPV